jgi:hypothetical protein
MATLEDIKARCRNANEIEEGDCWIWDGFAQKKKFPRAWINGELVYLRRYVYELGVGQIQPKRVIGMKCDDTLCLNPDHMAAKSKQQSVRAWAKKGAYCGEKSRGKIAAIMRERSKLSQQDIEEIRATSSSTEAAQRFGISVEYAYQIRTYKRWRDLKANPFAGLFQGLLRESEPEPA